MIHTGAEVLLATLPNGYVVPVILPEATVSHPSRLDIYLTYLVVTSPGLGERPRSRQIGIMIV